MNRLVFISIKFIVTSVFVFFMLGAAWADTAPLKLTLMLSEYSGAYLEYGVALKQVASNKNINLTVVNANEVLPDSDLVIAAGMKSLAVVLQRQMAPCIAVLVPQEGYAKLLNNRSGTTNGKEITAIYLDQSFKRQLALIEVLLPGVKNIGVLYSAVPGEIRTLRRFAGARNLELNEKLMETTAGGSSSALYSALQGVLQNSDVLLALPDAEIYNTGTIRNILLATYRNKVPLIGFSGAYVKAGALGAVYSTPAQFAEQTLAVVQQFSVTRNLPEAQYAKEFEVSVNEQVARSLGIIIKSATQVRSEMENTP